MTHVAHACTACGSLTIFAADAPFPRRCAHCHDIVHAAAHKSLATASVLRRLSSRTRLRSARPRASDEADAITGS